MSRRVHLYCTIVDNFGDIGVCWRLARQWVREYKGEYAVSMWVDDWIAARQMIAALPEVPTRESITVEGVQINAWSQVSPTRDCTGDVLIEGFGCTLPAATLAQVAVRAIKPVWINLEYFSAEDWVPSFHLKSGYDSVGRTDRWFFFPGVHADSGGILRERGLIEQRKQWHAAGQTSEFLARLGLTGTSHTQKLLCFAYTHAPYSEWLAALSAQAKPLSIWLCGVYSQAAFPPAQRAAHPLVDFYDVPFVSQPEFDHLLWSADVLWVRGEDSLARALWSGKPFVWHIYPQADNAHHPKLAAWLAHYTQTFPSTIKAAYIALHEAWNGVTDPADLANAWAQLTQHWDDWQQHSLARSNEMAQQPDLAWRLSKFVESKRLQTQTYNLPHENSTRTS